MANATAFPRRRTGVRRYVMKTFNHLFEKIGSWDNLLLAAKKTRKGKAWKQDAVNFHFRLENELLQLQQELQAKTYRPGVYRTFFIHDPKLRMISAAPYRDRVVHHALCNVIEPIFEKTFIHDSYANRQGKGSHKAIERYQAFAKQNKYVLKCDIRKFFPSVDHEILKREIRRKICCKDTLWLVDLIIDNSNPQEEHDVWFPGDDFSEPSKRRGGLPIGNLTSQFWANVYLNGFDHYIKDELGVKGYVRYVDDFVLFSNDKQKLHQLKVLVKHFLATLRLIYHPDKTQVHSTVGGVPFLGFRVYPYHRVAKKQHVKRYKRRLRKSMEERQLRQLQPDKLECRLNSWLGHVRFGQSQRLEMQVVRYLWAHGVNLHRSPGGSWRVLEQQS
ncbi:MAG: RNA-directed DNA polymerase [Saprospiraceae bacterium]|nr:RNA-directed DNA polymerase [Saprospiraceae bacterium]